MVGNSKIVHYGILFEHALHSDFFSGRIFFLCLVCSTRSFCLKSISTHEDYLDDGLVFSNLLLSGYSDETILSGNVYFQAQAALWLKLGTVSCVVRKVTAYFNHPISCL